MKRIVMWSALLLSALFVRLLPLWVTHFTPDADEAIVGLMGLHLTQGTSYPVFYYGQHYMGSLEPIMVSWIFKIFGVGNWQLKVVPIIFALITILVGYALARAACTRPYKDKVSLFTAWYLAISPFTFIEWSTKARGGFIEIVMLSGLLLTLSLSWLRSPSPDLWKTGLLGFLAGVGWWTNNLIAFALIPLSVFAVHRLVHLLYTRNLEVTALLLHLVIVIGATIIGAFPYIWYNCTYHYFWPSAGMFTLADNVWPQVKGVFVDSLPILLGTKSFWDAQEILPGLSVFSLLLGLLATVVLAKQLQRPVVIQRDALLLFISLLIVAITLFVISTYGALTHAPRYLLPLYMVLPILLGVTAFSLPSRWQKGVIVVTMALNVLSLVYPSLAISKEPFVFDRDRVSPDSSALIAWLKAHDFKVVRTNYWIGYRLAFDTQEKVRFLMFGDPYHIRIPTYETLVVSLATDQVPWILTPSQAPLVERGFDTLGYHFSKEYVGDYVILFNVYRQRYLGKQVALDNGVRYSSTHGQESLHYAFDNDLHTRFGTAHPQVPGMQIRLTFKKPQSLSGISFNFGQWQSDQAQGLSIICTPSSGPPLTLLTPDKIHAAEFVAQAFGTSLDMTFPLAGCKELLLSQEGTHPVVDWSIAELSLYQPTEKR